MKNVLFKKMLTSIILLSFVASSTHTYADANIIYAPTHAPIITSTAAGYNVQDTTNYGIVSPESEVISAYSYVSESIDYLTVYNIVENNDNYYCYQNGELVKNGWRKISKHSYANYASNDGFNNNFIWAFFTSSGKAIKASPGGIKKSKIGNYDYAFNEYGQLLTGYFNDYGEIWNESEGEDPFDLISDGVSLYHSDESTGVMTSGWYRMNGTTTRYPNKNSIWLYFSPSNYKITRTIGDNYKSLNINGKTYAFDDNGVMLTGFEASEYNESHGGTERNVYFGEDGAEVKSGFYNVDMSYEPNYERYEDYDGDDEDITIYLSKSGQVYSNCIKKINNGYYGFDTNGVLLKGLTVWNSGNYIATIDVENTDGRKFITSNYYVTKNGGSGVLQNNDILHYFGPNGRRMISAKLEFADNDYTYGASNNGAFNGVSNKRYFTNGLLMKPHDGTKIGVYVINPTKSNYTMKELSNIETVVVNSGGNIISNSIVKDENDYYWVINGTSLVNLYNIQIRKNGSTYYFKSSAIGGNDNWIPFGDKDSRGRTCVLEVLPNGSSVSHGAISDFQLRIPQEAAINFYIN